MNVDLGTEDNTGNQRIHARTKRLIIKNARSNNFVRPIYIAFYRSKKSRDLIEKK